MLKRFTHKKPATDMGFIKMKQPDSSISPTQKYLLTAKGI